MRPSERLRRIEAGVQAWLPLGSPLLDRRAVASVLDAAEEAVPTVSKKEVAAAYERGVIDGLYRAGLDEGEVALLRPQPDEERIE